MRLEDRELQHLKAAEGFAMLGMYAEAAQEVERIERLCRALPEVWRGMQLTAVYSLGHKPV